MSLKASCGSQRRSLCSLLAGREIKKPKLEDGQRLQEAAVQLLDQHQNLCSLFQEQENPDPCHMFGSQNQAASESNPRHVSGQLLGRELRRQADRQGISVGAVSVKTMLDRLKEITGRQEEDRQREMFTSSQRVQLQVLLESSKQLLSQGVLCPKLLWVEYRRDQKLPNLELVYFLHLYNILTLDYIVESDEGIGSWLPGQLKALCCWTPPQEEEETKQVQQKVLSTTVGVLVAAERKISVLDELLLWLLDIEEERGEGAERWIQTLDASLCGASVSPEALQRFFTHCLTQIFTCNPRLTVSDAVTLQNEWTIAKASRCLTSLYCKLTVIFSVEQLLHHLQQVLETHEVNWKHVLVFVSTLLVYDQLAQSSLRELLSRLLSSAFEGYDLEKLITAFLLARQGALEGAGVFPSYSHWFKMSFGGRSGFHAGSKKSLVFLLKFLSDLVPFEPPQYLKVHILHPPYVPPKHRSLLMEYVTLAKTRLADLKESVEDMGLYEEVSAAGASVQSQAAHDVEKAVCLFESTGKISATVMEASIFRRPYFLTRFLPALLKPRALPLKPDAQMNFIEALKKAEKIPVAQFSQYVESCQKRRQQNESAERLDPREDPLDVLKVQLQEFTELLSGGHDGETSAQLSRISHSLSVIFPGSPDEPIRAVAVTLNTDTPPLPDLHLKVVNLILQNFCQSLLITSRGSPPNKQSLWGSRFVCLLLDNRQLLSSLIHRLWNLFHHQAASLSSAHILGLAAFMVHLQASSAVSPLVQLAPPGRPQPVPLVEALSSAVLSSTRTNMLFSVRLAVAAVCYGLCRGDSVSPLQQLQQDFIPCSLYKKLLYLIPRLFPAARRRPDGQQEDSPTLRWSCIAHDGTNWTKTVMHLWRHAAFQQLQQLHQYQLCLSEWLHDELRVQRNEDVLSDTQRQEYQQWACWELYLPRPEEQGGCGGDSRKLCAHLLTAILEQSPRDLNLENLDCSPGSSGTCLPDLLSRLQEVVYEAERSDRADLGNFLLQLVSQRCSSSSGSFSSKLGLQRTVLAWNRVLLALPAGIFFNIKTEGGRRSLDCSQLVEHINQHQRKVCPAATVLPCALTAHLLKGLLYAAGRCGHPAGELNQAWSQMSTTCPLLVVSAVRWWQQLSPVLVSLWTRLRDAEPLPEQLQLLSACRRWAHSLSPGPVVQMPPAAVLVRAASLHEAFRGGEEHQQNFRAVLDSLDPEREAEHQQVLVSLLFLYMKDFLSELLDPQAKSSEKSKSFCSELLAVLVNSADWLLLFRSNEPEPNPVTLTASDDCSRLMPWAVCSLLLQQSAEFHQRALCCPGFLHSALLWYLSVVQLFLDGDTPPSSASQQKVEPAQILDRTKQFALSLIWQAPPAALSSSQLRQLQSCCADLDPELAAALSVHLDPHSLSPEMDFL